MFGDVRRPGLLFCGVPKSRAAGAFGFDLSDLRERLRHVFFLQCQPTKERQLGRERERDS